MKQKLEVQENRMNEIFLHLLYNLYYFLQNLLFLLQLNREINCAATQLKSVWKLECKLWKLEELWEIIDLINNPLHQKYTIHKMAKKGNFIEVIWLSTALLCEACGSWNKFDQISAKIDKTFLSRSISLHFALA